MPVVISFIGQKGGVGKSTLARAVAVVAAQGELRVTLVDLDFRQQTSVRWAETRRSRGRAHPLKASAYRSFDDAVRKNKEQDVIVVDTPGFITPQTIDIARSSNVVVFPTGSSADDLGPTVMMLNELERLGVPKGRLSVALCRLLDVQEELAARKFIEAAGYEILEGAIPERAEYRRAHNQGQSLTETDEHVLNNQAYKLIGSVLRKILNQLQAAQAV